MKYKYVLFDVDGTLVDSGSALQQSFVRVMSEETGRPVAPEDYARYWGVPGDRAFRDFGIEDEARIAAGIAKWDRYLQEIRSWNPPFEGIEELLQELERRGFVMGVVTSKNSEELEADFGPSPIARYLPHRVTTNDTRRHKPYPDPLLEMLRRLDARKEECLYVGDTAFDSQCAASAGIDFALAGWGLLFGEPEGVQAAYRLQRPRDLLELPGIRQD